MSVISAVVRTPAPFAIVAMLPASVCDIAGSAMKAPLPAFTSITRPSRPSASFFDRIEEAISGIDSTVPVTSRMA